MEILSAGGHFELVIDLSAEVGVRHTVLETRLFAATNLTGSLHTPEGCRHHDVPHPTFASTSSAHGLNSPAQFSTHQSTQHPVSLYAATKMANGGMAHAYAHQYAPAHGAELLCLLQAVGQARHGTVRVDTDDHRGPSYRSLQLRPDAA